jgi:glycosyltransferase involved in cell wall biosynthesis
LSLRHHILKAAVSRRESAADVPARAVPRPAGPARKGAGSGGLISIIVATYDWPEALSLSLQSLARQTDRNFEVIVADDGSGPRTAALVAAFRPFFPAELSHLWQEDLGFRKTLILNKAISAARGAYLIFLDGDCIVQADFVARHRLLAAAGHLVTGSRVLLGERLTRALCESGMWDERAFRRNLLLNRLSGQTNKLLAPLVRLPDSPLRNYREFVLRRIKGCNMACFKANAVSVGGFDETLAGWGHEDADFVFRLQQTGIVRKSGAFATEVLHLWHRRADRGREAANMVMLGRRIAANASRPVPGSGGSP